MTHEKLRACCRRGYARGTCEQASAVEADAVQVLLRSFQNGVAEVAWSLERNHHPVSVGVLAIEPRHDAATPVEAQALALLLDYTEQKGITA